MPEEGAVLSESVAQQAGSQRPPGLVTHAAITLGILGLGSAVLGLTPVGLIFGAVAVYAAIPYTVVAIIVREFSARRTPLASGREQARREAATSFALYSQRASLTNAVVMLMALVIALATGDPFADSGDERSVMSLRTMIALGIAAATGAFAIAANVPVIYRSSIVQAERQAVRERIGSWRLILATTILTTAAWIGYCGFAVYYLARTP